MDYSNFNQTHYPLLILPFAIVPASTAYYPSSISSFYPINTTTPYEFRFPPFNYTSI
jgi:hypothetical protein